MHTFSEATQAWFDGAFVGPTPAQTGAWESIAAGSHTLVVAPTGSGKTLAAFLFSLDRLSAEPAPEQPLQRCRVLYISPLKALAVDVERNLRSPLAGIRQASMRLGLPEPEISVAMRTGDTSPEQRRLFARRPADILITTPESLFLLLTSNAREALRGVDTVIIDEVHAVCATKRGAHLALSLERLDALLERPAQRIGLSATVRPVEEVATFLAGGRPVTVVQPPSEKAFELQVVVPVEDMSTLGEETDDLSGAAAGAATRTSIWPHVEERILDLIESHSSTIVFANSRRLAERLTSRLNEIASERQGIRLAETAKPPAQIMAESGAGHPASDVVVARAHHGSVSREQRAVVEEDLKAGRLAAVVATSSLELGIDMGAVDLVVQVEAPPSVASGLQRVGRAGHQVGATSFGVIFPKYRGDLVECAVVAERMRDGLIESMRYPRNPLDVLAQQIVAMVAMEDWTVDSVDELVRRCAPFSGLPRSALLAVLDMLAGRYPSDAFAELRPRLVWDRVTDELTARRGAQRLAVTSGGTIPDRGLFGVFLAGGEGPGRRVGELDEEMVYESRVGDVFLLGSSSWRIEEISHDQVLVTPAPGQLGRMPFWKGDSLGRPAELGRALGRFLRELNSATDAAAVARASAAGLDEWGTANLLAYLREQQAATGQLPDDRTVLVERFRDELGDWRVVVHSPFGAPVNAPWALAIAARLREEHGLDVQTMHSDDGIVLRLPETDAAPPTAELAIFDPGVIEAIVTSEVGGSALFASRFRECAARSLLLPRRDPQRRTPLWQQRQRASQLLQVASEYGDFPVVLEAMRECVQDVYDLPGLVGLMRDLENRRVKLVEVQTETPSPFARSLLFGYIGMFLYDGDAPLAERRAQALSLDSTLLAELLGTTDLRELLDVDSLADVEAELQRLPDGRHARGLDSVHDLLRSLGDLSTDEATRRGATAADLVELERTRRAIQVRIAGEARWVAIEDAGRLRDALGSALPVGVPEIFTEPVRDPLGDLVSRFARTHGPFHADEIAARLGLGVAVVIASLERLRSSGTLLEGEFRPLSSGHPVANGREWCDAQVLRTVRRRSLAALRREVEPVPELVFARFTSVWQGVGAKTLRGTDGVMRVVEQLAGTLLPASALESLVLPSRIAGYSPALLDELTLSGEVLWAGAGKLAGNDGWVSLVPADGASLLLPTAVDGVDGDELDAAAHDVLAVLDADQALFFNAILSRLAVATADRQPLTETDLNRTVWDLIWAGAITNDTLAPVRALLGRASRTAHSRPRRAPRARYGRYAGLMPSTVGSPSARMTGGAITATPIGMGGRWSRLPVRDIDPTRRALATAQTLLDRHGIVTRGAVVAERVPGGFAGVYAVLKAAEESGQVRRGYFVDGLGASQFALPGAVDRLRNDDLVRRQEDEEREDPQSATVLAATDPANPYGAALNWPQRPQIEGEGRGHQPARKAGSLVVLVNGACALYVERGGRTLLSFTDDPRHLRPAADALALAVREGALGRLQVERADGVSVVSSPLGDALEAAGFRPTPRGGLRLRGR
ncbi:Lhr family ATP dependent helicase [Jatrophihabitans sp. GAS493]|uniref:ATP-dependent helicase n=1 Tax=Jatrophihabitans sp. GAS493 TaxID=1907575 RepID=UPI000BB6D444|nr:ATP-dependent helicase [Jatrophihabitans sp. GAS493]SOD74135.1 Lhr family ATP dependent helicase [Jatrophihabitans sp. GAS493]